MKLRELKSIPCEKNPDILSDMQIREYLQEISGWKLEDNKIKKFFKFSDFKEALVFVGKVAAVAEEGSHHPDIFISYNQVELTIWTHRINGLSINDFIIAARLDGIPQ